MYSTFKTFDDKLFPTIMNCPNSRDSNTHVESVYSKNYNRANNRSFHPVRNLPSTNRFSLKLASFEFMTMPSQYSVNLSVNVACNIEAATSDFSEPFEQWVSMSASHHAFLPAEFHVEVVVCSRHGAHTAHLSAHL